jgi:hypothetical protein
VHLDFSTIPAYTTQLPSASQQSDPLPCTEATRTYHEDMDSLTFEALQRIMDAIRPRVRNDKQSMDDWLRVTAWMDEVATGIDDLDTLGTDEQRRELREVR